MAKTKVIIDEYETGKACKLYVIYLGNASDSEFDKFLDIVDTPENKKDLDKIITILNDGILEKYGSIERYFRYEGKMEDRVCALPLLNLKIRIYCIRISDEILILGSGGIKTTDTYQKDEHLNTCVETLQKIDYELKKLEKNRDVSYLKKTILDFPVELFINN